MSRVVLPFPSRLMLRFTLLLAMIAVAGPAAGQWETTVGPGHAAAEVVLANGGRIHLGLLRHGVYFSTDHGSTWQPSAGLEGASPDAFAANLTYVFAGLDNLNGPGGVYRSSDNGAHWQPAQNGIEGRRILSLLAVNSTIYAGDGTNGVFRSTDNGTTWAPANNGISTESIGALARSGPTLFAAGQNNLYQSTDGQNWSFTNGGQYFPIAGMQAFGSFIYAGGFQGLIRSTDGGQTWSNRIDIPFIASLDRVTSFAVSGPTLYASTISSPGSGGSGVVSSTDNGVTWVPANTGISHAGVQDVIVDGSSLVAAAPDKGVLVSTNGGASWTRQAAGLPPGGNIRTLASVSGFTYAGTQGDGVYRSGDNGATWAQASADPLQLLGNETVLSFLGENGLLLAGTAYSGVFRSTDQGVSWVQSNTGIPNGIVQALDLVRAGPNVLLGTGEDLWLSADNGVSWSLTPLQNATITALAASGGFAYANYVSGIFQNDGIFRSTNNGFSWTKVFNSLDASYIAQMRADGQYVYAGIFVGGMLRSTDHGVNWQSAGPPGGVSVYSLHVLNGDVYAGTDPSGAQVYRSTNHGGSWVTFGDGLPPGQAVEAIGGGSPYLFAGTEDEGVWRRALDPSSVDLSGFATSVPMLRVEPNPVRSAAVIRLALPGDGPVDLRVFDAAGRERALVAHRLFRAGSHEVTWSPESLRPGVYFLRLDAGGRRETASLVVVR